MKSVFIVALVVSSFFSSLVAQPANDISYYFDSTGFNPNIPKPSEVFGFEVGEWHLRHDQILRYMEILAEKSDRVSMQTYGKTYEQRKLIALTITSPENHQRLEDIRKAHVALSEPNQSGKLDISSMPIVFYMGFSVHGNEPSGANSSVLTAYRLAASNEPEIVESLKNSVILFDPAFNPDGLDRFAHWANINRGQVLVSDSESREHNEYWPRGRANHYWFDLNRDWLPVQHTEMVGRIALFHHWKPNVLTDHHEMGTNATFFFQPGIPSRTNNITPAKNQELTGKLAEFHAQAFDQRKALYFSKESYDDFYYGKGSTYPDVNGAVGILFEQASSRGHVQESINGELWFAFTIKNQVEAAFSTLRGGNKMREELLGYQRDFYKEALNEGKRSPIKGYVFGADYDLGTTHALVSLLKHHQIEVKSVANDLSINGKEFYANKVWFVSTEQNQYRLIRAIFETQTQFNDSLFYDVSSWTMPLAFNLPYSEVDKKEFGKLRLNNEPNIPLLPAIPFDEAIFAYVFELTEYHSHKALYELLNSGLRVKISTAPFKTMIGNTQKEFGVGTVIATVGSQPYSSKKINDWVNSTSTLNQIPIFSLKSGLTPDGVDLGSGSHRPIKTPKVALLTGPGVTSTDAGELWHLLDTRIKIPLTLIDLDQLGRIELSDYTTILMADGNYSDMSKSGQENLSDWIEKGGTLIAMKSANRFVSGLKWAPIQFNKTARVDTSAQLNYSDYQALIGAQSIAGSIFETRYDPTHPLTYGMRTGTLPVFRDHELFMKPASNAFANPFIYSAKPLLSGYISKQQLSKLGGTAAVSVYGKGQGTVIALLDNPNFRAFWYGPNKVLLNAIFFGNTINSGTKAR